MYKHHIHTGWLSYKDLGIEFPLSKNKSEANIFASAIDLDMERHHKNKCENNPFMNLGAETILQS